jgi:Uma2 family endonuclease
MQRTLPPQLAGLDPRSLPTEDELPCDDGEPMETWRHVLQMILLSVTLTRAWADRQDFFVGGNMFLYFSPEQLRGRDFRGPDVFVVLDVPKRERKSWVVWQEGKGPDVVIELLSESTARIDRGEKKRVYQDEVQVPEYYWYDPFSEELAGFRLRAGVYQPIDPDGDGNLTSELLGLRLVRWEGEYAGVTATWLRWADLDGRLLATEQEEAAASAHQRDEAARQRDEMARERDEMARERDEAVRRAAELEAQLARLRQTENGSNV